MSKNEKFEKGSYQREATDQAIPPGDAHLTEASLHFQTHDLVDPSNPKRNKALSDLESDESFAREAVEAYESAAQKAHDMGPEYYDTRRLFDLAHRASKIPGLVNMRNPDHNQAYFALEAHKWAAWIRDDLLLFDAAHQASKIDGLVSPNNPELDQAAFAREAYYIAVKLDDKNRLFAATHHFSEIRGFVDSRNPAKNQATYALEAYKHAVATDDKRLIIAAALVISKIPGLSDPRNPKRNQAAFAVDAYSHALGLGDESLVSEVTHRASEIPGMAKQVRNLITSGYYTERLFDFVIAVAEHEGPYQDRYVALAGELAGDDPAKRSQIPKMEKKQSPKL
ncbi:MAG TPA: hypothetical protein VGZ00_06995 [Candidatus Baltobacteraceae bacterium]|nr:hypothetical protein [Candidatus Baltobacteraceae bacterium]